MPANDERVRSGRWNWFEQFLRVVSPALAGDAVTYAGIGTLLMAIALFASVVPALRAAGVDPATALRHE